MERWVCPVAATALTTGAITQLYPANCTAGTAIGSAVTGNQIRRGSEGILFSLQIQTDNTNGGLLELWDIDGVENGIDTSSLTAITAAQMATAITAGTARLIYSQNFISSPETPINLGYAPFQKGLAARFSNSGPTGTCNLNLSVGGGYRKTTKI